MRAGLPVMRLSNLDKVLVILALAVASWALVILAARAARYLAAMA